jgi:MFS superfamily sulfate permease-like transporter
MTGVIVVVAVTLFVVGVTIGVLVAVAVAVRRGDRSHYSLFGDAPGERANHARYLNGSGRANPRR